MTTAVKRMALTFGAGRLAIGISAGAYVHAHDQNTSPQKSADAALVDADMAVRPQ